MAGNLETGGKRGRASTTVMCYKTKPRSAEKKFVTFGGITKSLHQESGGLSNGLPALLEKVGAQNRWQSGRYAHECSRGPRKIEKKNSRKKNEKKKNHSECCCRNMTLLRGSVPRHNQTARIWARKKEKAGGAVLTEKERHVAVMQKK